MATGFLCAPAVLRPPRSAPGASHGSHKRLDGGR